MSPYLHRSSESGKTAKTLHVLVVEDDADVRMLVADAFRELGCSVREAEHGQQALDILLKDRWRPDVIVLDLMMPVMDGIAFLARKRQNRELSGIPVVIVSATAHAPIEGASCVLQKPVDVDDLFRAVRRCAA